jgi:hypothetical protein
LGTSEIDESHTKVLPFAKWRDARRVASVRETRNHANYPKEKRHATAREK